jgi:transposase
MVQKNSHVWVEKHYYSVHHSYVGQRVQVLYNELSVEVYAHQQRIAIHQRSQQPHTYTTIKEHMPSTHQFVLDWHPERFIRWGKDIGLHTGQYIEKMLAHYSYPEQAYKSCVGILSLGKKYSNQRLEKACRRALQYGKYSYRTIEYILLKKLDQLEEQDLEKPQLELSLHDNIRGAQYYE